MEETKKKRKKSKDNEEQVDVNKEDEVKAPKKKAKKEEINEEIISDVEEKEKKDSIKSEEESEEEEDLLGINHIKKNDTLLPVDEKSPAYAQSKTFLKIEKNIDGKDEKVQTTVTRCNPKISEGLSSIEAENRSLAGWGNNAPKGSTKTIKGIIFTNVFTIFNLMNFIIAVWLISIKAFANCAFMIVVTANIIISTVQEIRAKKIIDNLSLLSAPSVTVIRDSCEIDVSVDELVLDDIMVLTSGKQICSDAVVRSGSVEVNESLLTGEADAIVKNAGDVLLSGSFIVSGKCYAQIKRVANDNYIQKLSDQAKKYQKPKSDLLKSLKLVIRTVSVLIIILAPIYFVLQSKSDGYVYKDAVSTTAGAVIGMIPSGLFLLTSVALAVGVLRLANNKTLVQELYCIEMLARVNVLCLDKTGTITDGTMTVRGLVEYKNPDELSVKQVISAFLNAQQDNNLTSQALEKKFGLGKKLPAKKVLPFSSTRKLSAVEFQKHGTYILGAPEFVLKNNKYPQVFNDVEVNAKLGYRVLVLAWTDGSIVKDNIQGNIEPIALIIIEDTIRPDAIETINYFKENDVNVKVISGDNPLTVSKVAQRAGIANAEKYISLEGLTDKEVVKAANNFTVFGRVSPAQKKLLIRALKGAGNTVAMTGDGVNDILALKEADCSIAMASGSEAARNVSHLVLLDSNFASMPKVVNEGRRVINNIQRVASLFLTKTIFSTLLLLMVVGSNVVNKLLPEIVPVIAYPLEPKQLYIIDYFVIAIPSVVLALQSNKNRVKGNFLKNVLKVSIPSALTVITMAIIAFLMSRVEVMSMTSTEVTTIIMISATYACFLVLFRVCKPFDFMKGCMCTLMFTIFVLLVFSLSNFFDITNLTKLSVPAMLLLITLLQAAYPIMQIYSYGWPWLKKEIKIIVQNICGTMDNM